MIFLIHQRAKRPVRVINGSGQEIQVTNKSLSQLFWDLADRFPDEIIGWCEEAYIDRVDKEHWAEIFHHDMIMASYAVEKIFLPESIGYIDHLPFVNINRKVLYGTWRMSSDVGGISGRTLLKFKDLMGKIRNFEFLLNSIAKVGQQNGLFCFSAPELVRNVELKELRTASHFQLFAFTYSHYKSLRLIMLFWYLIKYERKIPLTAFFFAIFHRKYFRNKINLSDNKIQSSKKQNKGKKIDVILPTLGRREHLLQVLEDLKAQRLLPQKVIIIEQNSNSDSKTALPELQNEPWPFTIVHHFIHRNGACNARNMALEEVVDADWVFFADDDIRIKPYVLQKCISEMNRLGIGCLNLNCKQPGEKTVFPYLKQWGSFGSGTSMVSASCVKNIRFREVFEYGFGEDKDYGMQLRQAGCDIIYHPGIEILHLKAPRGGFREVIAKPWQKDFPKPSPTMMVYVKTHYTFEQLMGYRTELFFRFYPIQKIRNPFKYIAVMRQRWRKSVRWSKKIMLKKEGNRYGEIAEKGKIRTFSN